MVDDGSKKPGSKIFGKFLELLKNDNIKSVIIDQELKLDFVNDYAGMPFGYLTQTHPKYPSYKEDWAESCAYYQYIIERYSQAPEKSLLKNKEKYLSEKVFN